MADVASKQQTTALFLSTTVTRTRRHTELTQRHDKPDGKPVLCQSSSSSVFLHSYIVELECMGLFRVHGVLWGVWGPFRVMRLFRVYDAL